MRPAGGSKLWPLPEGISGAAAFSDSGDYRYLLSRSWSDSARPMAHVAFVGLNPSTAEAHLDDPTVRKLWRWAREWGYGGIYMLNLYAYRATSPADMKAQVDPVGRMNDAWIRHIAEAPETAMVVACWGTHGDDVRKRVVIDLIPREKLRCFGLTKGGFPKHPLYLPNGTRPESWVPYCASCGSPGIYFDPADGYTCTGCGATDADA